MDARLLRIALLLTASVSLEASDLLGATFRTPNFVVNAETEVIAKQVALTAERCREELAIEWLGKKLPRWYKPCDVNVSVGQVGAGGATSFAFDRGEVFGWRMRVQGTLERILDSVIPHEVSHTIFACHFRRPLPRWADEGAATLIEHDSERRRQVETLKEVFNTPRRMPLKKLFSIKEYPRDMQDVLTLYAQGYSVADFLVRKGGKAAYLEFLNHAHEHGWDAAIKRHYGIQSVDALEKEWCGWVIAGSPQLPPEGQMLADAGDSQPTPRSSRVVFRSQAPDEKPTAIVTVDNGELKQRDKGLAAPDLRVPTNRSDDVVADAKTTADFEAASIDLSSRDINQDDATVAASADRDESRTSEGTRRLPRPSPLMLRQPLSEQRPHRETTGRAAKSSANQPQDLKLSPESDSDEESRNHPAEEQELSASRSPDWSGFPQHRSSNGSTRLGIASADPVSP